MRLLVFALAPLLLANVYMWWPHSVIFSLCWAVVLIASPRLLPE
jgi:hypothetical protein